MLKEIKAIEQDLNPNSKDILLNNLHTMKYYLDRHSKNLNNYAEEEINTLLKQTSQIVSIINAQ